MENSLAIALATPGDYATYKTHLQELRYWGGYINGYGSRIHYFSGWLLQNEKKGLLRDLTREMGGIPYQKQIGYISARPAKYPKIKDLIRKIQIFHPEGIHLNFLYITTNLDNYL